MDKIVAIGAGQAGASLVARLRGAGFDGRITLIGDEGVPPYQRPPLSKAYLMGEMAQERLFLRPEAFYAEHAIELRLGTPVSGIDRAARRVALGSEVLDYDHLILCTGGAPNRLPAALGGTLQGVFVIRSLADVDALAPEVVAGRQVVILGGGYIGLEAAAVAAKLGLRVHVIEAAPRILSRVAAPETADAIRALHHAHGVTIHEETAVARIEGAGRVTGVALQDGRHLAADLVILGIGVRPRVGLAEAAGLTLDNGIAVDAMGRSSDPRIWAAGDCASFPWRGRRVRLESVQNAIEQAELVADNILGAARAYDPVPWFWSDQYDLKLQIAGLHAGYDRVVTRTGPARSHWYYAGDQFLAVDALGDPRAYMVGKRLLEQGRSPDPARLRDPRVELKDLLRA